MCAVLCCAVCVMFFYFSGFDHAIVIFSVYWLMSNVHERWKVLHVWEGLLAKNCMIILGSAIRVYVVFFYYHMLLCIPHKHKTRNEINTVRIENRLITINWVEITSKETQQKSGNSVGSVLTMHGSIHLLEIMFQSIDSHTQNLLIDTTKPSALIFCSNETWIEIQKMNESKRDRWIGRYLAVQQTHCR